MKRLLASVEAAWPPEAYSTTPCIAAAVARSGRPSLRAVAAAVAAISTTGTRTPCPTTLSTGDSAPGSPLGKEAQLSLLLQKFISDL